MTEKEEDVDSEEEGIQLLLGGLTSTAMTAVEWENEEYSSLTKHQMMLTISRQPDPVPLMKSCRVELDSLPVMDSEADVMKNAHHLSSRDGRLERPNVRIVNFGNEKGNGLVLTKGIKKGDVIFTERAFVATTLHESACHHCFKSLVSIDACGENLPCPHLWPNNRVSLVSCFKACGAEFCSPACQKEYFLFCGDCCVMQSCLDVIPDECRDIRITLATKLFVAGVHQTRNRRSLGSPIEHLCGAASELSQLELGISTRDETTGAISYTMLPLYDKLSYLLKLSDVEALQHSEALLAKYVSVVARNSFGGCTMNPFESYFAALLRSTGGRSNIGTPKYDQLIQQVATAVSGVNSEKVSRDMNRKIQEIAQIQFGAIFALTARCNHSCDPNVEVKSSLYVDIFLDLVARRDLLEGEELLLSYIPKCGNNAKRQRELKGRYLFDCDCSICRDVCSFEEHTL